MRRLRAFCVRLRGLFHELFRREQRDRELAEELACHLQLHIEDNLASGMPSREARRQALIKLGGVEQAQAIYRDRRGFPGLESLLQDVRFALRMPRQRPGVAALAIVALGLGIGANTAVFSVANSFLRRPVPFPALDRLVMLVNLTPQQTAGWSEVSPADYLDWKSQSRSFEQVAAWRWVNPNLTGKGDPEKLDGARISSNFFDTLGVKPRLGRPFTAAEDRPGQDRVAILSYGLWQRRFGSDASVLGKTVELDGVPCAIVGVMGKDFAFPLAVQIWRPLALNPGEQTLRSQRYLMPVARLKPGVSGPAAAAELAAVEGGIARKFPQTETAWKTKVMPVTVFIEGDLTGEYCRLLIGAVLFVLLIACANVGNLLSARAAGRRKEIAIRQALGASRARIVRQLLTESLVLAFAGGCLGLLVGQGGIGVIRRYMSPEVEKYLPMWSHVRLEASVFWYTVAVTVFAGLIAGLAPALHPSRAGVHEALQEGGHGNSGGVPHRRLRALFVVAEVCLSLVLLIGAGLMVKGVHALLVMNPNLDPAHVLTMVVELPPAKYPAPRQQVAFFDRALAQFAAIPGVRVGAVATNLPFGGNERSDVVSVRGRPLQTGQFRPAAFESVSAGYFGAMKIPLRRGRLLTEADGMDQPRVVVVSQSFAQRYFHGENPLGEFIKIGGEDSAAPWARIVGVVGDIRYNNLGAKASPPIYFSYRQMPDVYCFFALRAAGDPAALVPAVRSRVEGIDPDQPVSRVMTLQAMVANGLLGFSYVAVMLSGLGIIALMLATVGLYGVMACAVAERAHEIGVRMALGASPRDVLRLVLGRGLLLTVVGLGLGLPAAWALARLMAGLFFGVSATDLSTFIGITALMGATTLLACYLPARRAMRMDPLVILRQE